MKLHTCMVSYERLEATQRSLASYLETVSVPFTLVVVDNRSRRKVRQWLQSAAYEHDLILLDANMYPGYATNRGWERAPADADFFHRADNDFIYREGWCEHVAERFAEDPQLGQLGLRTDEEEAWAPANVGGNCVIRRELWDKGLRWDERPWGELACGYSEDSYFSPAVEAMGYTWGRVTRTCIDGITSPDPRDRYYVKTYADRNISSILKSLEK